jgi:hypothetical protein
MTYILAAQRDGSPAAMMANFDRYKAYLRASRSTFPPGAYALATSDWYYDFADHRCPHDAWLEKLTVCEPVEGPTQEQRVLVLELRLLGAYHDGYIILRYPRVFAYRLDTWHGAQGHRDWRYDEFRLSEPGNVVHEIEWAGKDATGRWLIEASDVEFSWEPRPVHPFGGPRSPS